MLSRILFVIHMRWVSNLDNVWRTWSLTRAICFASSYGEFHRGELPRQQRNRRRPIHRVWQLVHPKKTYLLLRMLCKKWSRCSVNLTHFHSWCLTQLHLNQPKLEGRFLQRICFLRKPHYCLSGSYNRFSVVEYDTYLSSSKKRNECLSSSQISYSRTCVVADIGVNSAKNQFSNSKTPRREHEKQCKRKIQQWGSWTGST